MWKVRLERMIALGTLPFLTFLSHSNLSNIFRGGSINSHPGNERFRLLVEKRKRVYLTARFKREKRLIASSIVSEIRGLNPAGRFLTRDSKSGFWKDIGDEKARDKASQALRENAPSIRAEIETEINVQRADMKREENLSQQQQPPPPHPPPPYYGAGWGGYSYYGNYPAHTPSAYPPHPNQHPQHSQYDYSHNAHSTHEAPHPHYYAQPTGPSTSAIEPFFDFVNAGAESFKNWATSSLNSVIPSGSSRDGHGSRSASSKPISYIHEDMSRKRRLVKFKDEYAPMIGSINSIATDSDFEPHHVEHNTEASNSVLAHFADRVMGSLGSFDAVSVMCGHDSTDTKIPFPVSSGGNQVNQADEEMEAVEWEGQEVQLMEQVVPDERVMPPPDVRPRPFYDAASSMGMSSIGSCHSWFPEQISAASSYFRGADESGSSNDGNMSIGGNSLVRVFDHETSMDSVGPTSSWDRASFPTRSPMNLGSDDESLMSKGSNKSGSLASRSLDMTWESRE